MRLRLPATLATASVVTALAVGVAAGCGGGSDTTTAAEPTTSAATTTQAPAQTGDVTRGKAVFASAGCGSCHTLSAAEAAGTVGPNLDEAKPSRALVVTRVTNGKGAMPSFKDQLSAAQIEDVAAYVSQTAGS